MSLLNSTTYGPVNVNGEEMFCITIIHSNQTVQQTFRQPSAEALMLALALWLKRFDKEVEE